jgi:uncharacterized coiled-coil protein SlyX
MELHERIKKVVEYSGLSIPKFAVLVGFKTPQAVREILNGRTKTLSDAAQMKILQAFPGVSRSWLLTGEGEMLNNEHIEHDERTQNSRESSNFTQSGNVNTYNNGCDAAILKALDEISAQRKVLEKAQDEISAQRRVTEKAQEHIEQLIKLLTDVAPKQTKK